jgi:hypothetical protein
VIGRTHDEVYGEFDDNGQQRVYVYYLSLSNPMHGYTCDSGL